MRIRLEHSLDGCVVIAGLRQQFEADLRLTLPLGASVLVPGLDLSVGERQRSGQVHSVLDAEVLLPFEASLQLLQLMVGEGGSGFAWLLGLAVAASATAAATAVSTTAPATITIVIVIARRWIVSEIVALATRILVINVTRI